MAVVVIGIAGGSASGKTSVANKLVENQINKVSSIALLRLDDYYKDLSNLSISERSKTNFDHPDSIDFELLSDHLHKLKNGKSINKPIYDFSIHNRQDKSELIKPVNVVILEGILALSEANIRKLCDIKIFVDTADDIRFIRRLKRDTSERGRTIESVISQ